MRIPFGKPGVSCFLFALLLAAFNWPLLSIPGPERLFAWLFAAWALAIALLGLVASGSRAEEAQAAAPPAPKGPERAEAGPGAEDPGPDQGPGAGGGDV
ncbi:MAG: hypothetical protein KKA55_14515 [Proteobacteria bacterium]|nr:hypothetical protein [Pseudomonadota bacterium]MBU1596733.1 hypothetical protein [Pseudomonadota bacterium]